MNISLSTVALGLASSIITEIFKFVPALRKNSVVTAIVSIIVVAIVAFVSNGLSWSWDTFVSVMIFAFGSYKLIIQPVANTAELKSQG